MDTLDQRTWSQLNSDEGTGDHSPARTISLVAKFGAVVVVSAGLFTGDWGTTQIAPTFNPHGLGGFIGERTTNRRVLVASVSGQLPPDVGAAYGDDLGSVKSDTAEAVMESTRGAVRWLHDSSGLTWEQLGRVFGVSRRAVHMWANGSRMNASNVEALHEFIAAIHRLGAMTPDATRNALLSTRSGGTSLLDEFRARHRSGPGDVSGARERPDFYLGAQHGDVED
ncbi:hypothetical protein [Nocardia altamirensis]|uniref:hypothetical protein n=1 Tax=Nocardia altamirensis TaxID=472158 RepID=UPI00114D13E0|nr:hypothetical protein [Nocardia altamirensis]